MDQVFRIVVKGTPPFDVEKECRAHGIERCAIAQVDEHSTFANVTCDIQVLQLWFGEDLSERAPFRVGALLHFSSVEAEYEGEDLMKRGVSPSVPPAA